ncbi:MAG: tetratricopeptide repeat protein [Deltaproteobacteria bacterium]|nr:tetratricopeptide repeat protein [Deltaproteobacteria bacterium]
MGKLHAAALLLIASVASAQPQPQPSPAQKQQASNLVKQAIAKSQAGDHATAIELYLQAYALIPQPLLLSNIGSEYQQENKPVEALKYFCKYLDADPTGSNVSYATAQAKTLQLQMGNKVDDKDVCKPKADAAPLPPPDTGSAAVPPPDTGSGQVTGTVDLGAKPAEPSGGEHPGKGLEYAGLGVAAVGAIGLGAGIYFGIQAKNASDTITNHKATDPWPANIKQIEADGQADENKQVELLIGGGVALVAGGVLYFIGHSKASSAEHVSIAPVITPNGAGLAIGGSY